MRNTNTGYKPLLWILVIPVLNIFYGILNHGGPNVVSLTTDLDERIPFVPAFIIPYLIWYPFILAMLIVFFIKMRRVYYQTLITLCLGLVACYITYYFYQTVIIRPTITGDGFINWLVSLVYSDNPYNCFPSIHVLTSYLMLKGMSDCTTLSKTSRLLIFITSWTIIISTLFVKQHFLLDIAGAILLAEVLYFVVGKLLPVQAESKQSVVTDREENSMIGDVIEIKGDKVV
ncbi:inositol phosphorylceramide synthase [Paenibacillus sp. GCM10027626]|uniref:inositol phosphorylceramide synthase n=1 Tax=Paenibacillus sp. GCM10027626 TaxID=3273411 RepID=UPI00362624D4